jgi:hypothetical protein
VSVEAVAVEPAVVVAGAVVVPGTRSGSVVAAVPV